MFVLFFRLESVENSTKVIFNFPLGFYVSSTRLFINGVFSLVRQWTNYGQGDTENLKKKKEERKKEETKRNKIKKKERKRKS